MEAAGTYTDGRGKPFTLPGGAICLHQGEERGRRVFMKSSSLLHFDVTFLDCFRPVSNICRIVSFQVGQSSAIHHLEL